MKEYILDRFEGNIAVLEDENENFINIDVRMLIGSAKEGDILLFDGEKYIADIKKTTERKKAIRDKFESLIRKRDDR